jgi:chromosome partitioning protein
MTKVIAFGQQKGGVGKSAASINVSYAAHEAGHKVALIDMDSEQATTKKWGARRNGAAGPTVISAGANNVTEIIGTLKAEGYDWIFLDLPGRSAPTASAGLVASDLIVIPCRPLDVDLEASVATVTSAKRAKKEYVYLMNIAMPQEDKKRARQVAGTLSALGHSVAPTIIVQRIVVPDAIAKGKSALEEEPKGSSANEFRELFAWLESETKK